MGIICSGWIMAAATVAAVLTTPTDLDTFSLRIIHTNDMHSRFEQISKLGGKCREIDIKYNNCYGGFPRLLTAVKIQQQKAKEENIPLLFLNAGDTYQGSPWYTVHKWRIVSELMNLLPIDAMSLGNHEFDDKVEGLIPFINASKIPIVTCNLGLEEEPELAKTPLKPSLVLNVTGRSIGIIGYLTPETALLAQTGNVKINDEVESVASEARKMKENGIDIIIAVGHSGYDTDLRIAKHVPFVDAVIGGHTNTFLYTGIPPDSEIPTNLYPTMVTQSSGRKVAVVQAYAYTKYLGVLNLEFDRKGELVSATGNPQLLNYKIPEDPGMLEAMEPWREAVVNMTRRTLGITKVLLDGDCRFQECNLGNLIADAFIHCAVTNNAKEGWTMAPIALQQAGGIRAPINGSQKNGEITMEDVYISMPFSNTLEVIRLKGKYLLEALEWSVSRYDPHMNIARGEFLQFSGLQVVYNLLEPRGRRVVEALVRCGNCSVPRMEPIQRELDYDIIMSTFLAKGGDNYTMFAQFGKQIVMFDKTDTETVADFIEERKILYYDVQGKIKFITGISTMVKSSSPTHNLSYLLIFLLSVSAFRLV